MHTQFDSLNLTLPKITGLMTMVKCTHCAHGSLNLIQCNQKWKRNNSNIYIGNPQSSGGGSSSSRSIHWMEFASWKFEHNTQNSFVNRRFCSADRSSLFLYAYSIIREPAVWIANAVEATSNNLKQTTLGNVWLLGS